MTYKLIIGIFGIVTLTSGWLAIQLLWRTVFKDEMTDEDVLAGRSSCSNCGCTTICNKRITDTAKIKQ